MERKRFEGWYFKHQLEDDTVALIPGKAAEGAFVQLLTPGGARYFTVPDLSVRDGAIRAGGCLFSPKGCHINLPGVSGAITYGAITPLASDIMGPFRFLPMQCRHGILSMAHSLRGSLTIDGRLHAFDGGTGYIEKDSGTSFPSAYQWLQCNVFPEPCAITLCLASIPFGGLQFTGCLCALLYGGCEYQLATYQGVHIRQANKTRICLTQKSLRLTVEVHPSHAGHSLKAPLCGQMTGVIRESLNAQIHVKLWKHGRLLLDLHSPYATCEYVAPEKP